METNSRYSTAANARSEVARQRIRQADLADALGMSQQALSRRLNEIVPFDVDELHRLADFLKVPASSLLGESTQAPA